MDGTFRPPQPVNEPVRDYAPGSPERRALRQALAARAAQPPNEIPLVIGGRRLTTGRFGESRMPHDHRRLLARFHQADGELAQRAAQAALAARPGWSSLPWSDRAAVLLRAAELLSGPWRMRINAAARLELSKTPHQAEIDAACELADYWRFNVHYLAQLLAEQPLSPPGQWNQLDWRPLEGFVLALTPFNFVSIAGNLPTAPALLGNTVVWKPASRAVGVAAELLALLEQAGLPPGVINLLPGPGEELGPALLGHPELAGLHFTGSTGTLRGLWQGIAANLPRLRQWPRIVGETGGKGFVVAHPSSDPAALTTALVRGAFEYQGQKCSAASRAYLPRSRWPALRERLVAELDGLRTGDVADFANFCGAVIDEPSFARLAGAQEQARRGPGTRVVAGGGADGRVGWFITPTVVEVDDPRSPLMTEELFGPLLAVHLYADDAWAEVLQCAAQSAPYALTGAVFCRERAALDEARRVLRDAAGNLYVNDKPTGAVVGQQPFGGGRGSGTNDKAGSPLNLLRWASPRTIKEQLSPALDWRYPYLAPER